MILWTPKTIERGNNAALYSQFWTQDIPRTKLSKSIFHSHNQNNKQNEKKEHQ